MTSPASTQPFVSYTLAAVCVIVWTAWGAAPVLGQDAPIRLSGGLSVIQAKPGPQATAPSRATASALEAAGGASASSFPQPPLAGFRPLVAIVTSNAHSRNDLDFAHQLQGSYTGSPLNPPASENFMVGTLDSGSVVNLIADPFSLLVGLDPASPFLTDSDFPIGGASGTISGTLTFPLGIFVAGLGAVSPAGVLDLSKTKGHSNVSIVVTPEISCGETTAISGVVGTPLLAFYKSIIRVDQPRSFTVDGQTFASPDVQLVNTLDAATLAGFPRAIPMTFGGLAPATTASYYPSFDDLTTPIFPTLLSMSPLSLPTGGAFFAKIGVLEGEPGPTNPLQFIDVMVDTGAQASIISPAVAASMNLDLMNPEFTLEVCGIGGAQSDVPGFYVDYVKINASGGALEFSNAPFVVMDLESPAGGPLAGILGMNFFHDRNIIFDASITGSSFVRVSDPIAFAYGDLDRDMDVDLDDFGIFQVCSTGPDIPQLDVSCLPSDSDGDGDVDQEDFGRFQVCFSGPGQKANPTCGPPR